MTPHRPAAPWGSFPLVELVVLIGLAMLVGGAIVGGNRGTTMIAVGLGLAALAGVELSVREHLAGYRSHTTMLAGIAALLAFVIAFALADLAAGLCLALAAFVFAFAFWRLRAAFRRASGGVAIRM